MARKKDRGWNPLGAIPQDTRRAVLVVVLIVGGLFLTLAAVGAAGIAESAGAPEFGEPAFARRRPQSGR